MRRNMKKWSALVAAVLLACGNIELVEADTASAQLEGTNPVFYGMTITGDGKYMNIVARSMGTSVGLNADSPYITMNTGKIDQDLLITGTTAYSELRATGTYIKANQITATNLKKLDTELTKLSAKSTSAGSATDDAEALTVSAVDSTGTDGKENKTISITANTGTVSENSGKLVTGGELYTEFHLSDTPSEPYHFISQDNTTAGNLLALDAQVKTNTDAIADLKDLESLTTKGVQVLKGHVRDAVQFTETTSGIIVEKGEVDANGNVVYTVSAEKADIGAGASDTGLVTGGDLYSEVHVEDGFKIQAANTTAQNLKALDTQIETNRTDILGLRDLSNLTPTGTTNLRNFIKDGVQVAAGNESITVNHTEDETGNRTYTISAQTGAVAKGSNQLVTGGTVYEELLVKEGSYNYISPSDRAATNLMTLDAQVKTNADNIIALDQRVGNRISVLSSDLYQVGASAAALAALHPEPFDPDDKWSFAVGYGHYRNRNAAAVGIYLKPDADTTISLGGTVWSGDPMLNVSTSFKLGSRGKAVKPMLNPELQDLVKRVKALEEAESKQDKAFAASRARLDKAEATNAIQADRVLKLEEANKKFKAEDAAQAAADKAKDEKIAALHAEHKALKADALEMEKQIAEARAKMGLAKSATKSTAKPDAKVGKKEEERGKKSEIAPVSSKPEVKAVSKEGEPVEAAPVAAKPEVKAKTAVKPDQKKISRLARAIMRRRAQLKAKLAAKAEKPEEKKIEKKEEERGKTLASISAKPETKAVEKTEAKPVEKIEQKPVAQVEMAKDVSKTAVKPEAKAEAKAPAKVEKKEVKKAEKKEEESGKKALASVSAKSETKAVAKTEQKQVAKSEAKAEVKVEKKAEAKAKSEVKPEVKPEAKAEVKSEVKAATEAQTKADAKATK